MHLYGTDQLADGMRAVRSDTLLIAADIPESQYHYRPTPESRSVAETLVPHFTRNRQASPNVAERESGSERSHDLPCDP